MPDLFLLGLAFSLGYLVRIAVSSSEFHQLRRRVADHLTRRCPVCGAWHQKKTMMLAKHKVAGMTRICRKCYDELYHPYQKGISDE